MKEQRLLVVDDSDDIRAVVTLALTAVGGFDVRAVDSGASAVERVRIDPPDAVLLDLAMPGLDGVTTLSILRDLGFDRPVVLMTATPDPLGAAFDDLDVAGVITKPFDPLTVADRVRALLR